MAPSKKQLKKKNAQSKKNQPRAKRGGDSPSRPENPRAARSSRRSLRNSPPIRRDGSSHSAAVHPLTTIINRRKAKIGPPDPSAPTRRDGSLSKLSASRLKKQKAAEQSTPPPIVPLNTTTPKKASGHKACRGGVTKVPVPSSDEDSDYKANSGSDGSVDVATASKVKTKVLYSVKHDKARVDKNVNQNRMSLCGLVKPPASIYDGVINFDAPLQPLFEEYKFRGNHPQWPPPSIMCCLRPPVDKDNQSLEATQFSSYRTVSSCYPFVYQDDFAIEDGEYLILCLGDTPEFCNLF
jgi:hypothetical protein